MIDKINEFRREYQRDHLPFEIHGMTAEAFSLEGLEGLAKIGITEVVIAFRNPYEGGADDQSLEEKIAMINWYAENIIQPYRERAGGELPAHDKIQ